MNSAKLKTFFSPERSLIAICIAAFFMAVSGGIYLVAVPYMVKYLGGSDGDVGLTMALNFAAYLGACLAGAILLDRFNPKQIVKAGIIGVIASMFAMYLTMVFARRLSSPILVFNIFSIMMGAVTALFWPPLLGWISAGHEGKNLSHHLGSFSMAWSSGSWFSPYIGGVLVGINPNWPMLWAGIITFICLFAIGFAKRPNVFHSHADALITPVEQNINLRRFQWMARLALVLAFICVGLVRTQLALLFKFDLGYTEATFGLAVTIMCLANFLIFLAMGRIYKWHYIRSLFWGAQVVLICSMLMIIFFTSIPVLFAAALLAGLSEGFVYASHLFYGVTGAKRRLGLMAIHEVLLSTGVVIGSVAGGYISDSLGRYAPYWFGTIVLVIGLLAQFGIWLKLKPMPIVAMSRADIKALSTNSETN